MVTLLQNEILSRLDKDEKYNELLENLLNSRFPLEISGVRGGFLPFVLSSLRKYTKENTLIVVPGEQEALELYNDLKLFTDDVCYFPWWGTMVYKGISAQAKVFGQRVDCLVHMLNTKGSIIIASLRSYLSILPPPDYLAHQKVEVAVGGDLDLETIEAAMVSFGYLKVSRVTVPGEFALRGEVLDYYPPGHDEAVRIVFEFDEVEEIKYFNPVNQVSSQKVKEIAITPVKEVLWQEEELAVLEENLKELDYIKKPELITEHLSLHKEMRGEEIFFPLAFKETASLNDYISEKSLVCFVSPESLESNYEAVKKEYYELYRTAVRQENQVPAPDRFIHEYQDLYKGVQRKIILPAFKKDFDEKNIYTASFCCDAGRSYFGNINYLKDELTANLSDGYKIYIFAESESQAERLGYMLKDFDLTIISSGISSGFTLPDFKITVIQENEIFGRRKRAPSSIKKVKSQAIDSFVDLSPGDYVVHVNHGIGRFKGIERIKAAGNERDYIALEYAGEEISFIPIEQVNLVQRYIGQEGRAPKLDILGGKSWAKKKSRVRKNVEDLADMLIALYAKRNKATGYAFPPDDDFQVAFEASFPYQETEDQLTCIQDVKQDMESPKPMDRLICGDVGYGKTEIAMRAAFKGVMGGRQVAFLCPTTILAEQHYENFLERFKRFPVKIGMLSRFVTKADQKKILGGIEEGELDIVIGTHRLLSRDVKYKKLGLVMVDEEQRFGVKDKEKLKELKHSIDSLALSATPIPRTLHMSLVKIRDMSVLKTAPYNRHPVETIIQEFNDETVAQAIRREVERDGQVFFLHNRVESLESIRRFIERLVPEVMVEVAHGQMSPTELEDIMHRFIHGGFQVLVSTTIVENGIDIPNVNTIIIDRADMYGISQLYQLRGRVGRSGKVAYAYLFYPDQRALSEIAMKRLQIISDFTELGSGFKIAMKDMEVRGAGNLLGREQSGEISSVGFDMYLRLLEEAVQERDPEVKERAPEVYLELTYTGFIPDSYIKDPSEKMEVYKKIAAIETEEELSGVNMEIYDRFGPLPDEVQSLLSLAEIRIICRELWIKSVVERKGVLDVEFGKLTMISPERVMKLITSSSGRVRYNPARPASLMMNIDANIGLKEKSEFIRDQISLLK